LKAFYTVIGLICKGVINIKRGDLVFC